MRSSLTADDMMAGRVDHHGIEEGVDPDQRHAAYRIVHFATHGALAGELKAGAEPGLILTLPGEATPE